MYFILDILYGLLFLIAYALCFDFFHDIFTEFVW